MTTQRACTITLILLATLAAATPVRAQAPTGALRGVVVEHGTGAAVPLAHVRLVELHREEPTHGDGVFELRRLPAGTYTVLVRALGYRPHTSTITIASGGAALLTVRLEPMIIQLSPTVVTGTVGERPGDDVLSPTTVVADADLDRRLGATVAATLQSEPGVAVTSLGPATARPVIRGLGGDRILVLEDGTLPGDLASQSADHAVAVEPLTAERMEVVRGPMGLLYGSSALGGVINVVREEIPSAPVDHAHGAVSVQGTSVNGGISGGGLVQAGHGPLALRAEVTGRTAGDTRTPDGALAGTQFTTLGAQVGAAIIGDARHGGLSYRFYDNDYGVPGGFVGGHATDVRITMRRHALRGDAGWHEPGLGLRSVRLTGTVTAYQHQEREPSGSLGTSFDQDVATLEAVARRGHDAGGQGAFGVRLHGRRTATAGTLRTPDTRDLGLALYGVQEWTLDAVRLQAGLRWDVAHFEPLEPATILVDGERVPVAPRDFSNASWSVGALWRVSSALQLGANVARAFRTPTSNELYSDGPHLAANSYDVGDPDLAAETGLGAEVLARWSTAAVQAEAAVFVMQLADYISPSSRGRAELGTQGNRPRFQYTNEDARFAGAEGSVAARLAAALVLDITVSAVWARFTSERSPIPIITPDDTTFVPASPYPPLIPPLNGRLALRWDTRRWFVGAGTRWAAAQSRTGDFESPTDGYVLADLTAGVRLLLGSRFHTFTLRVDNLLDASYRDHLSRLKDVMPGPGRDVSLLYRLAF